MTFRTLRIIAMLVAAALLSAACGSTVQRGPDTAGGVGPLDQTTGPADSEGLALGGSVQRPSAADGGAAPSSGGLSPAVPGQESRVPQGAAASGGAPPEAGPAAGEPGNAPTSSALNGVTDEAITVGVAYPSEQNEASAAFGVDSDFADWREVYEIMVEWANANGGVNGRELVAYHRPFTTAEFTGSTFWQQLCTDFTQDQDVYLAMPFDDEQFVACAAKAGVPSLNASPVSKLDAQALEQYRGFVYGTSGLDLTQTALLTAQRNVATDHLTPESTVGMVTFDAPSYERAAKVFEAELAEHGIGVAETVLVTSDENTSAQLANTVLRFRSLGVDRVTFLEVNGVMWYQFVLAAEAQGYRPQYVLNPTSFGEWFANSGLMPAGHMDGSKGVSIHTTYQINRDSEPFPPPGRAICREIFDAAGMPAGSEDSEGIQVYVCELVRFLKAALDRASDLSPPGLQAAVESLGRTVQPGQGYGSYLGPGYHTGAGAFFHFEYVADCHCFRMSSDILDIPGTPN